MNKAPFSSVMSEMRGVLLVLAVGVTMVAAMGCDPSYTLHLTTTVKTGASPVQNAWVVPMPRGDRSAGAVTGADGKAKTDETAFLQHPIGHPILIKAPGRPTCVVRPGANATMKGRGFFFVTEFDAALTVDLTGAECSGVRHLPLPCADGHCEVAREDGDGAFCDGYVVRQRAGQQPTVELRSQERADGGTDVSHQLWSFPASESTDTASAFALVCITRTGDAQISVAE